MTEDPIVNTVIDRMVKRSEAGMKKYRVTTKDNPQSTAKWIDEAIEEALDFCIYLERLKVDILGGDKQQPDLPLPTFRGQPGVI